MNDFRPQIEWRDPESLTPHINNAKTHPVDQVDRIAGQIAAFGFDQPIVIDSQGIIIKGHGRREAALRLGLKEVPVIVQTLDEYQASASRIGDNKVAESPWDYGKLKFELGTLDRVQFDTKLTGFQLEEIGALTKGWDSDLEKIGNIEETNDASTATIKIHCSHEQKAELLEYIQKSISDSGFEGVEIV